MLKKIWFVVSIFLICTIFFRMPQENIGLSSFASKSDLLGSPTSAQKSLNSITATAIVVYFLFAVRFNLDIEKIF